MNTNTPEDNNNNANVIDVDESNDNININDSNNNINIIKKTISKWDVVFYFICRLSNIFYTTICYVVFPFFRYNFCSVLFCSVLFSFYWLSPRRSLFSLQFHSILLYCFLIPIFLLISFLLCLYYYYYKWITGGLLADALPGNNSVYMSCSIISHYSV